MWSQSASASRTVRFNAVASTTSLVTNNGSPTLAAGDRIELERPQLQASVPSLDLHEQVLVEPLRPPVRVPPHPGSRHPESARVHHERYGLHPGGLQPAAPAVGVRVLNGYGMRTDQGNVVDDPHCLHDRPAYATRSYGEKPASSGGKPTRSAGPSLAPEAARQSAYGDVLGSAVADHVYLDLQHLLEGRTTGRPWTGRRQGEPTPVSRQPIGSGATSRDYSWPPAPARRPPVTAH